MPPGVHEASWDEVASRFGGNSHREWLMERLLAACRKLAEAGCTEILLDGSFVTEKAMPGDYDGTWETAGVDVDRLDPVFLNAGAVRAKYFGDLLPAAGVAEPGVPFRDFFQTDRNGVEKGVVLVDLRSLP
ncbi:MAG: hypothetical protein OXF79_03420 [Chloroflexi bacterium]|nr:hypothetical protein [Chloroflexota bacterium]